jgi:hypothetical protein
MTTHKDTLNRAAALLESSTIAWTQRHFARDLTGGHTRPKADNACSWCALGAIKKVAFDGVEADKAIAQVYVSLKPKHSIIAWNDAPERTREEVIVALREAATTTALEY